MTDQPNSRIPEDIADDVLEVASRLYADTNNSYSLAELKAAGQQVNIPPELIDRAIEEVREKQRQEAEKQQQAKAKQQKIGMIAAGVGVAIALWGIVTYNSLAGASQKVDAAWAQVENQLQRRADLIPNLISISKAQAQQEKEIISLLSQSREAYLQAENPTEKIAALTTVNNAIQQFNQYAAGNPQLQSSQAFTNLQYEMAGTENRIATERMRYNQAVEVYNRKIQSFPNSLVAGLTGFEAESFFEAETKTAPKF